MIVIEKKIKKKQSPTKEVMARFVRNKVAVLATVIFLVIVLLSIFANVIVDYQKALDQDLSIRFQKPTSEHWFGTDSYGRDIFARIIHGSRVSLSLGLVATLFALLVGGTLGAIAGYYGDDLDEVIMRILDAIMAIPGMLFALAVVAALGSTPVTLLFAVLIFQVPNFARIVRSAIMGVANNEYIDAAEVYGAGDFRIILKYAVPNAMGPIIVQTTMSVATLIIIMAGLSFIGMGIQPPTPEWGLMLSESKEYIRYAPWLMYYPGGAIIITALSLNLMGDGLRDAFDPKLKD